MGRWPKYLANFFAAAAWWVVDRLYGDAIFDWLRPMIPDTLANPTLENIITFGPLLVVALVVVYLAARDWKNRKADSMSQKYPQAGGIALDGCIQGEITNCKGDGLSTFIRARNSSDIGVHNNRADNTETFMDLENVRRLRATNNEHNTPRKSSGRKPEDGDLSG